MENVWRNVLNISRKKIYITRENKTSEINILILWETNNKNPWNKREKEGEKNPKIRKLKFFSSKSENLSKNEKSRENKGNPRELLDLWLYEEKKMKNWNKIKIPMRRWKV